MTAYVSNHQKKKETLARRVADLRRSLLAGSSREAILKSVQLVRDSQIRALEAQLATVPPTDDFDRTRADVITRQIEEWRSMTADDVLSRFQK